MGIAIRISCQDGTKIMLALVSLPQPGGTKDNGTKPLAFKLKHFKVAPLCNGKLIGLPKKIILSK